MKIKNYLNLLFFLFIAINTSYSQWNQIGQEIKGSVQYQQLGNKTAISGDGNRILVYSLLQEDNYYKGKIQVFDLINNNWLEILKIENLNDATSNTVQDAQIDISNNGNVIAFTHYKNNEHNVSVYKYNNSTNTFSKYGIDILPRPNVFSGGDIISLGKISLNNDGKTIAVSFRHINNNDEPQNIVNVYNYDTNNWVKKGGTLKGANFYRDSRGDLRTTIFGNDIDLSGDGNTIIVGEKNFIENNLYYIGRVTVFNFNNNRWIQLGNKILGTVKNDSSERLGAYVSISNNGQKIAVGSQGLIDKIESVGRVYQLENNKWKQIGNDLKVRGNSSSKFDGISDLSLNGDGSIIALSNTLIRTSVLNVLGAIATYQYSNNQWLQRSENKLGENHFGSFPGNISISNNGKRVITSSFSNQDDIEYSGKVIIFENEAVVDRTVNSTYIPDNNFEQTLIDLGRDDVLDNYVLTGNISSLTSLNLENKNITDLTGIEAFTALSNININNNNLTNLDISKNVNLVYLYCAKNSLTNLNLSKNIELLQLDYSDNNITAIDLRFNSKLQSITASRNEITAIDVTRQKSLDWLILNENFISEINLSFNPNLRTINISNNRLNKIEIKNNTTIESINVNNNSIQSLNIAGSITLKTLKTENNQLSSLDLSTNTSLENLFAKNNSLECIQVADINYANVNWSSHTDANVSFNTDCSGVWVVNVDPTIQTVLMSVSGLDANNDGNITIAEAAAFTGTLDLSNTGISIVEGLQAFTGISTLNLSGNSITDLSPLTGLKIEVINKSTGKVKSFKTQTMSLKSLIIDNNNFESLNLNTLTNLKNINISNNPNLKTISLKNGNNAAITAFNSSNTSNLSCIIVDNINADYLLTWTKDEANNFVSSETDCRQRVLSFDSELSLNDVKLFPNPVSGTLTIESPKQLNLIEIYNTSGKRVLKTKMKKISFSKYTSGVYFLKIISENKILIKKIIKK